MRRFCFFILILLSLGTLRAHKPTDTLSAGRWEFVQNLGQWEAPVLYKATIHGGALFFERNSFVVTQLDPNQLAAFHESKHSGVPYPSSFLDAATYRVTFLNALKETKVTGIQPFDYYYNYYIGQDASKWASHVSIYHHLIYNQLYPDIDLYFLGNNDYLKYEFHVAAGGDPKQIQLRYDGLKSISKAGEELLLHTAVDRVLELAPFAYQINEKGDTIPVDCSYSLSKNIVSFSLGQYDSALPLVIDPTVVFSSYSGSTADNWGYTATYDSHGNLYGGGIVDGIGYPTSPTSSAYQTNFSGLWDITISKFDSSGRYLHYSTYLGGSDYDVPHSLYVNDNDELYIFGTTGSADFPVTRNAFDATFNGGSPINIPAGTLSYGSDIFIAKLSADGTQLPASTFIGGSGNDGLNTIDSVLRVNYADEHRGEIIVDENSNIYVIASTNSTNFPTTTNGYISNSLGGQDACVFKMSQDLSTLIWSTYFGGSGNDAGYSMFLAADKSVYFCGGTTSTDLPVMTNAYQTNHADNGKFADGFVAHLSANGNLLLHSSYLGKNGYDQAYLIKGDHEDFPHILGQTSANNLQWVHNANYFVPGGGQFLIKLSTDLTSAVWSTAFGTGYGGPDISPTALLVDYCDNIYLSGWGGPNLNKIIGGGTSGLPITDDAFQTTTDNNDFYFMAISEDASNLVYATYFGGDVPYANEHVDGGTSRFDKHGKIYQAACAGCRGQSSFPTTPGAYSNINGSSNCNLGVIKIDFSMSMVVADFIIPNVVCLPEAVFFENHSQLYGNGASILWDFGDGTTSTDWEPYHTYQTPGYYIVTLVAHAPLSCNNTDTLRKKILVLANTFSSLPTIDICAGDFAELGIPPAIGVDYVWSPTQTLNNPYISNPIATPAVSTLYTLIASTARCVDTLTQRVVVHHLDIASTSDSIICFGESATFSINVTTTDNYTIEWSESADFQSIIATNTSTITVTPEASHTYYVRVTTGFCIKTIPFHTTVIKMKAIGRQNYLLCFDNELYINLFCTGGTQPYQYQWLLGDGESSTAESPLFTPQYSTNYTVTVTDANGCNVTMEGHIAVREGTFPEPPQAWCTTCEVFAYHKTTLYSTEYGDYYTYQWTPSQNMSTPDQPITTVTPDVTTTYTVSITDTFGCTLSDTVTIKVDPVTCEMPFVFIPNSFTPNGDGINDILYVRSDILEEMYFIVYSRWGERIFETHDQTTGWDGSFKEKDCQTGVYDYYFKGKCKDGDELELKGNVTLIR